MAAMPNSLLTITLASNFGTFLLYGLSCIICMVAYAKHPNFSFIKHWAIPVFGVVANLGCMAFYLIGPFMGYGTKMEPLLLRIAAVWAIYGGIYFVRASKSMGRTTLVAALLRSPNQHLGKARVRAGASPSGLLCASHFRVARIVGARGYNKCLNLFADSASRERSAFLSLCSRTWSLRPCWKWSSHKYPTLAGFAKAMRTT